MRTSFRAKLGTLLLALASGCGARTQEHFDSQSHWLTCEDDEQCGELSCHCAVCTAECESDSDCWSLMGHNQARCQAVETLQCSSEAGETRICVPDCGQEQCVVYPATEEQDSVQTERASGQPAELVSVPECPAVAETIAASAFFRTDLLEYAGAATVTEISATHIVIVPEEVAGEVVEVTYLPAEFGAALSVGQRFDLDVEVVNEGYAYRTLTVRGEAGELLLFMYSGFDVWYQDGQFDDSATLGGTLVLRMACQSNVGDVCFASQVQSEYTATFTGDDKVVLPAGTYVPVTVGGSEYQVYAWAQGVFGGDRLPDCNPDVLPGRSMSVVMARTPPEP